MLWMMQKMLSRRAVPAGKHNHNRTRVHKGIRNRSGTGIAGFCHCVGFWACRPRLLRLHVSDMLALRRSRVDLAKLDAHQRADIGISDAQIRRECKAPLLGEISSWAPLELRAAVRDSRRPPTPPPRHERSFYRTRGRSDLQGPG